MKNKEEFKKLDEEIKKLNKQIELKNKAIDKLTAERNTLINQVHNLDEKIFELSISEYLIEEDNFYLMQEQEDWHYIVFDIIKINKIINKKTIEFIGYKYRKDDNEYTFITRKQKLSLRAFLKLLKDQKYKSISLELANKYTNRALNFEDIED